MIARRQILQGLGALPFLPVIDQTRVQEASAAVTCPDPTPGSVTNQTGAINGTALTDLVDAYGQKQGVPFQWQYWATLSTKPGACAHYRANETVKGERWLILVQVGAHEDFSTPVPPATGTFTIGQRTPASGSPYYVCTASYASHSATNCNQTAEDATGGTITYTTATDTLLEGSYALDFESDHVTGDFSAPYCLLCVARPTKKTCVA
jgi:hypothetical protein